MELRHLRYLVAVATEGTYAKAAGRLRVAQPALSRQIRDLERTVGATLLDRGARGASLTAAGDACVALARHVLAEADAAAERARLASHGRVGQVVLAAGKRALMSSSLAAIVASLREEHPDIQLEINESAFEEQWDAIHDGRVDIGLGMPAPDRYRELHSDILALDRYDHLVVASSHRLASRECVSVADLGSETILWPAFAEVQPQVRDLAAAIEQRAGAAPEIAWITAHGTWIARLRAGQGITLGPAEFAMRVPTGTIAIPLEDFATTVAYSVVSRRRETRPVVRTVIEAIRGVHAPMPATPLAAVSDARVPRRGSSERFELRHLRYFVAVASEGGFGRAAEQLGITQPALSRQIRDLEVAIGVPLLDRETRGATPTLAGESLLRDAARLLGSAERLPAEIRRAQRGVGGECIVATVPTPLAMGIVARALRESALAMPATELHVEEMTTPAQVRALVEARIDLGLGHSALAIDAGPAVNRLRLVDDVLDTALLGTGHPLANARSLEARQLADEPFLFIGRAFQPVHYDAVMAALRAAGLEPRIDATYDGQPTMWAMAAEGRGWVLGAHSQRLHPPPAVVAIPLLDISLPWGIDLLQRADEHRRTVLGVVELLRRAALFQVPDEVPAPPSLRILRDDVAHR